MNIRDAQMNSNVGEAAAAHLALRKTVGVDGYLVALISDAMQDEGAVEPRGCFLRRGCLQMNLCANDSSPRRIEHGAAKVAALLCEQIPADAQYRKEEETDPTIHRLRIAPSSRAKQCILSSKPDDNCHRNRLSETFGFVSGHDFSRAVRAKSIWALQAAEKLRLLKG
jgi:hypothetical protein